MLCVCYVLSVACFDCFVFRGLWLWWFVMVGCLVVSMFRMFVGIFHVWFRLSLFIIVYVLSSILLLMCLSCCGHYVSSVWYCVVMFDMSRCCCPCCVCCPCCLVVLLSLI